MDSSAIDSYKLVVRIARPAAASSIQVVRNLSTELKRRCIGLKYNVTEALHFGDDKVNISLLPFCVIDPSERTNKETLVVTMTMGGPGSHPDPTARHFQLSMEASYSNEEVFKKLVNTIKAARKQHKKNNKPLAIFIDSHEVPDLLPGFLHNNPMFDKQGYAKRISNVLGENVLFITRRQYSAKQRLIRVYPFFHHKHRPFVRVLMSAFGGAADE